MLHSLLRLFLAALAQLLPQLPLNFNLPLYLIISIDGFKVL